MLKKKCTASASQRSWFESPLRPEIFCDDHLVSRIRSCNTRHVCITIIHKRYMKFQFELCCSFDALLRQRHGRFNCHLWAATGTNCKDYDLILQHKLKAGLPKVDVHAYLGEVSENKAAWLTVVSSSFKFTWCHWESAFFSHIFA